MRWSVLIFSVKALNLLALIGLLAMLRTLVQRPFLWAGSLTSRQATRIPLSSIGRSSGAQGLDCTARGRSTAGAGLLDDPEMVEAGGRAYVVNGCTYCHGEPGVEQATFYEGLNPPPDLRAVVTNIRPEQPFWVIKNGIKMTAMPSFGADNPAVGDKNIWAIVGFLKNLSSVSDKNFKARSTAHPGNIRCRDADQVWRLAANRVEDDLLHAMAENTHTRRPRRTRVNERARRCRRCRTTCDSTSLIFRTPPSNKKKQLCLWWRVDFDTLLALIASR